MTLNENALTTVEALMAAIQTYPFLPAGIKFDDPDVQDELTRLINEWSSFAEAATHADFGIKEYTEYYKGTNQPTLVLKHYPIIELKSLEQVTYDGSVVSSFDVDAMALMDSGDYRNGMLYIEPNLVIRTTGIGIIPEPYTQLRSYKVVYTAGFTLPKDATDEEPCTLPSALQGFVIDMAKKQFIANTDAVRAEGLITLTEGNVQRMWATPTEFKLTKPQEKILAMFKRRGI